MTTQDRSMIPVSLQPLDWQSMAAHADSLWYDSDVLLAAVPLENGGCDIDVVTIDCDGEYFGVKCNGEHWGWDFLDIEWFVVISGNGPQKQVGKDVG